MTQANEVSSISTVVLEAVAETAGVDVSTIGRGDALEQDLRIDSLEFVRLVQIVEDRLAIHLTDEQAVGIATVDDLIALCQAAKSALAAMQPDGTAGK